MLACCVRSRRWRDGLERVWWWRRGRGSDVGDLDAAQEQSFAGGRPDVDLGPAAGDRHDPEVQRAVLEVQQGREAGHVALGNVATDAFASQVGKNILDGLNLGFILHGNHDVHQVRSVTITGATSILTECWIGRAYSVSKKFSPAVTTKPLAPAINNVNLVRSAGKWRVAGFTEGPACAASR
jgi:hypothetical protein